jgi:hypothetical protein
MKGILKLDPKQYSTLVFAFASSITSRIISLNIFKLADGLPAMEA